MMSNVSEAIKLPPSGPATPNEGGTVDNRITTTATTATDTSTSDSPSSNNTDHQHLSPAPQANAEDYTDNVTTTNDRAYQQQPSLEEPRAHTQTDRLNKHLLQSLLQRMQDTEAAAAATAQQQSSSSSSDDNADDWE